MKLDKQLFDGPTARSQWHKLSKAMLSMAVAVVLSVVCLAPRAWAQYRQINLVGNTTQFDPVNVDPNLINGWGLAALPDGPWWIAAQNTVSSPLYNANGTIEHLLVDIPCVTDTTTGATTVPCIIPPGAIFEPNNPAAIPFTAPFGSGPSGIVANPYPGAFREANGQPAQFIYTTLDGLIVAWNPANGDNAVVEANQFLSCTSPPFGPGSCTSYQGLAIAGPPNDPHLYATNLFSEVDVFDKRFNYVGSFAADADISSLPTVEQPFVPYGIQAIGDKLYVTYYAIFYPSGNGLVDVCDLRTSTTTLFCQRIIDTTCEGPSSPTCTPEPSPSLESPWGMVLAPWDFGPLSNTLLIGNVDNGLIHAFDPRSGKLLGTLTLKNGTPFAVPGLWGLAFGYDSRANGSSNSLFFDAGPSTTPGNPPSDTYQYSAGLFGVIQLMEGPHH